MILYPSGCQPGAKGHEMAVSRDSMKLNRARKDSGTPSAVGPALPPNLNERLEVILRALQLPESDDQRAAHASEVWWRAGNPTVVGTAASL